MSYILTPKKCTFLASVWGSWFGGIYILNYLGANVWVAWAITSAAFYVPYLYRYRHKIRDLWFNVRFYIAKTVRW